MPRLLKGALLHLEVIFYFKVLRALREYVLKHHGPPKSIHRYLITLNIKIIDLLWTPLSSYLSKMENWRTDAEMKHHMILDLPFTNGFILLKPSKTTTF